MPTIATPDVPASFPSDPPAECNLVMKGGITSGVVYPAAILELQRKFRFRAIGGTSAGAIAAAFTAAAELGRETGGFQLLAEKSAQLAAPGFIEKLFTPAPTARPLIDLVLEVMKRTAHGGRGLKRVLREVWGALPGLAWLIPGAARSGQRWGLLAGLVPAVLWLLVSALPLLASRAGGWTWVAFAITAAVLGVAAALAGRYLGRRIGVLAQLARTAWNLPRDSFFGVCVGFEGEGRRDVLTPWLADSFDQLAGRAPGCPPLTFADLRNKSQGDRDLSIDLRMMTSDLSLERPYVLPFRPEEITERFLFQVEEMRRFFPARIVQHLVEHAQTTDLPLPPGYCFLPLGDALPVVFATRLSLSFPFLLSAVPLYTIPRSAFGERDEAVKKGEAFAFRDEHLQKNWFSDGGISSNFPIHFFDSWAPLRPTFGINLEDLPPEARTKEGAYSSAYFASGGGARGDSVEAGPDATGEAPGESPGQKPPTPAEVQEVFLPRANQHVPLRWNDIGNLPGFGRAIVNTARNHRDNLQAQLASYRERIVHVRFAKDEGGLNLAMTPETVANIQRKGALAGGKLLEMDFEEHFWVHFLVLMAELEAGLGQLVEAFPDAGRVADMLTAADRGCFYRQNLLTQSWRQTAEARVESLRNLRTDWEALSPRTLFRRDEDLPRPKGVMRITPRV